MLALVVDGRSNHQIAAALRLGAETVKAYVGGVLRKLGAANRTQAAVLAVRKGLVP